MLNSNSKIKKSVASALMNLVGLIIALSICCSITSATGDPPAKKEKTGSSAATNLDDITLGDVFRMLAEKFPEVPFNTEESSSTSSEGTRPQDGSTPQNETPPSIWENCCAIC